MSPKIPGSLTYPEIGSQAEALAASRAQLHRQDAWIDRYLRTAYDEVVFIGSGSSYYQAQTMAATFREWLGRSAIALPSSELFLFRETAVRRDAKRVLVVGVSRSGESTEVILALEAVQSLPGWSTCGITCHETSKLYAIADSLLSPKGKEESTVMTKSFSSMTYMMQCAIAAASGDAAHDAELRRVEAACADVTAQADLEAKRIVDTYDLNKFIYLGMGAYYGLAQEASLKIKEMSYVWTEAFGTLEFRHGPKSIVEPGTLVVAFVSEAARAYELKVAEEMKGYGATVLLLVERSGDDTAFADETFVVGGAGVGDAARASAYMPLVQYLGYYTALKRGLDPDHPRNLTQVVKI